MIKVNLRTMTINHGTKTTEVTAEIVNDLGGGIKQVVGTYQLEFADTFDDGNDTTRLKGAIADRLTSAGVIAGLT